MNKILPPKSVKKPSHIIEYYGEIISYIHGCFESCKYPSDNLSFNVDGIIYQVSISKNILSDIDITSNSSDIFEVFSDAIEILSQKGKVCFKYGSTDKHKIHVMISTEQSTDLVRQSIQSMANEIL